MKTRRRHYTILAVSGIVGNEADANEAVYLLGVSLCHTRTFPECMCMGAQAGAAS